MQPRTQADQDS